MSAIDAVASVLREHQDGTDRSADDGCFCGQHDDPRAYEEHAARLIVAAVRPAIEAAALRGAADALRHLYDDYMGDAAWITQHKAHAGQNAIWLEQRADHIAAPTSPATAPTVSGRPPDDTPG